MQHWDAKAMPAAHLVLRERVEVLQRQCDGQGQALKPHLRSPGVARARKDEGCSSKLSHAFPKLSLFETVARFSETVAFRNRCTFGVCT